ncbi:MAG TPA: hypothetical protein V6D17_01975, partial [Candidatus Obscuribacterales bacterium]
ASAAGEAAAPVVVDNDAKPDASSAAGEATAAKAPPENGNDATLAKAEDAAATSPANADSGATAAKTESQAGAEQEFVLANAEGIEPIQEAAGDGPIVIDNDEHVQQKQNLTYEELPTDAGKTKIKIGGRFPVVIASQITSKTAKKGDPIEGRLKYDLKIGDRLVAKKGSVVRGHVNYALKARTILHSLVSPERWYRNSGCLGIDFDEIINERGEHIPCSAAPSRQSRIVKNKAEGRELGVNHYGQITGPWGQQLRYKAVRIGLNFALAPAGVFSFGAMPVALGVIGAANPNFAFSKPVGLNVRHRRLKGFAWGFLSGIPGSWLIEDTTVKGQEAIIKPGDEFLAEFKQEFTGEPETEASLLSGASTKVKGQVVSGGKKKKSK